MKSFSLLISPLSKSAYFNDYIAVAEAELAWHLPDVALQHLAIGGLDFIELAVDESVLPLLSRLSVVQGVFSRDGDQLTPVAIAPAFQLHEDFVFGSKFKGKTNELLTQMLMNVGLQALGQPDVSKLKLLDPMCGRATTLLWAMRYGINAKGIEQDPKALADIMQSTKKWCKVHRQKHQFKEGFVGGKATKQGKGKFIEFSADERTMRVITGDSAEATQLLNNEKFDLIISDLPYGVQHFTTHKTRNPLAVLKECAPAWKASLKVGGVMVLAFNNYLPKRKALLDLFADENFSVLSYMAPHRMSEAIVRDVVVIRRNH